MTLRPEYSLGHSPYNAFLFAAIGEEQYPGVIRPRPTYLVYRVFVYTIWCEQYLDDVPC